MSAWDWRRWRGRAPDLLERRDSLALLATAAALACLLPALFADVNDGASPWRVGLAAIGAGLLVFLVTAMASGYAGRWRHAEAARACAERFRMVVETIGEVIFLVDRDGRWAYLNPAWEQLSGVPVAGSLGRPWLERIEPEDAAALAEPAAAVLAGTARSCRQTLRFVAPDGPRWVDLLLESVRDTEGRPAGAAGTLRDVDERKRLEEHALIARHNAEQRAHEATLLASTDELTGVASRRAFLRQLDREIEASAEFGWPLSIALFDVDHFKAVNDQHGHAVGDRVLQHIAARAAASVRGGDMVGRLGGEEFAILMRGAGGQEAAIVAERLRRAVQAPDSDGGGLPLVTVSIGLAQREDRHGAEALLAAADAALYAAKDEGRNRIRVAA